MADLEADNKSLNCRNRALMRALNGDTGAETLIRSGYGELVNKLVFTASEIEREGRQPIMRFARGANGRIIGIELAVLETKPTPTVPAAALLNCNAKPREAWATANHARSVAVLLALRQEIERLQRMLDRVTETNSELMKEKADLQRKLELHAAHLSDAQAHVAEVFNQACTIRDAARPSTRLFVPHSVTLHEPLAAARS